MNIIKGNVKDGVKEVTFGKQSYQDIIFFYNKLIEYSLYWQLHTPTAFGNPDYNDIKGFIYGYASAKHWGILEKPEKIIVKTYSGKKIIELEILPLPDSYYESLKENAEVWNHLL